MKSYPLNLSKLKTILKTKEFKNLARVKDSPLKSVVKIQDSSLNYIVLHRLNPTGGLYLIATVLRKRLETRFMIGGVAQNDKFSIGDTLGEASSFAVKQLQSVLLEDESEPVFTENRANAYLSTFDAEIFNAFYTATRMPAANQTEQKTNKYLLELYEKSNNAYNNGTEESTLSDYAFDNLRRYLIGKKLVSSTNVGATPEPTAKKVTLETPLGSLENAFTPEELKVWFKKYPSNETLIGTPKIDGISAQVNYVKGVLKGGNTKGNGYIGEDITALLKVIPDVPKKLNKPETASIRCELFIPDSIFNKKYGQNSGRTKTYKTPRNMMSGLKNRKNPDATIAKDIRILGYSILNSELDKETQLNNLKSLGFPVVSYFKVTVKEATKAVEKFAGYRKTEDYAMDGAVLELNSNKHRNDYVGSGINPRFAVAFKPDTQEVEATIKKIAYTVTKDRMIIPGAVFDPVTIGGVTVTASNLHHYNKVRDWGLGPGAVVIVTRQGDAIPHVARVIKAVKPQYPKDLEYTWNASNVDLVLKDGVHSDEHEIERIISFFTALKVERFSSGLIKSFYEHGIKTIPDILRMSKEQIVKEVSRQGETSAANIVREFQKLKNPGVALPSLLYASGCFGRGLGESKFNDLYKEYGDELVSGWSGTSLRDVATAIGELRGFSEDTGLQFAKGLKPYIEFYRSVKGLIYVKKQEAKTVGKLTGQLFAFSGFRNKQWKERIEELGGEYKESVSAKTTILVSETTSEKTKKAEKNGTRIISIAELQKLIK